MKKHLSIYSCLALVGLGLTWYFNLQYLTQGGSLLPTPFLQAVSANPLSTAITIDVYLAALVFSIWVVRDACLCQIPRAWIFVVLTFAVGLCFAWPLYLHIKQSRT